MSASPVSQAGASLNSEQMEQLTCPAIISHQKAAEWVPSAKVRKWLMGLDEPQDFSYGRHTWQSVNVQP